MKRNKKFKSYDVRNICLSELGYCSYSDYLKSDDWRKIRNSILENSDKCILCMFHARVVHHVKYDMSALLGLRPHVLAPLCFKCHESIEFNNGEKASLSEANLKLFSLARKNPIGKVWLKRYHSSLGHEKQSGQREAIIRSMQPALKSSRFWKKYENKDS